MPVNPFPPPPLPPKFFYLSEEEIECDICGEIKRVVEISYEDTDLVFCKRCFYEVNDLFPKNYYISDERKERYSPPPPPPKKRKLF